MYKSQDIYRNGKRHKEYLKLYLIDAKTYVEKEQNRQTLATAQAIDVYKRQEYDFAKKNIRFHFQKYFCCKLMILGK